MRSSNIDTIHQTESGRLFINSSLSEQIYQNQIEIHILFAKNNEYISPNAEEVEEEK